MNLDSRCKPTVTCYLPSKFVDNIGSRNFKMADPNSKEKPKLDLGLLEEDDEFEEFPAENWTGKDEDDADINVWEDNWDDETTEDDFSIQLRAEIEKTRQLKT